MLLRYACRIPTGPGGLPVHRGERALRRAAETIAKLRHLIRLDPRSLLVKMVPEAGSAVGSQCLELVAVRVERAQPSPRKQPFTAVNGSGSRN